MKNLFLFTFVFFFLLLGGCVGEEKVEFPRTEEENRFYKSLSDDSFPIDSLERSLYKYRMGKQKGEHTFSLTIYTASPKLTNEIMYDKYEQISRFVIDFARRNELDITYGLICYFTTPYKSKVVEKNYSFSIDSENVILQRGIK